MFAPHADIRHETDAVDRLVNEGVVIKPLYAYERIYQCWRMRAENGTEYYGCLTARPTIVDGLPKYDQPWRPGFFVIARDADAGHAVFKSSPMEMEGLHPDAVRRDLFERMLRLEPVTLNRVFPVEPR